MARRLLVTVLFVMVAVRAVPQSDACTEPADAQFHECVKNLAIYTRWLLVAPRAATPGALHSAVNSMYDEIQSDWTGSFRSHTYLQGAHFAGPALMGLFILVLIASRKWLQPRFYALREPEPGGERIVLVLGAVLVPLLLLGERIYTFRVMQRDYEQVRAAVTPFIHLSPAAQLANTPREDCERSWGTNPALLAECQASFATVARKSQRRNTELFTANPDLRREKANIAQACRVVQIPFWWSNAKNDPGNFKIAGGCTAYDYKAGSIIDRVTFRDILTIADLDEWLGGKKPVYLETGFTVEAEGTKVYQAKVATLLDAARSFRNQFYIRSAKWSGPWAVFVAIFALVDGRYRKRELLGSEAAGKARRLVSSVALGAALVALLVVVCMWLFR